jgi:hypothetical protein
MNSNKKLLLEPISSQFNPVDFLKYYFSNPKIIVSCRPRSLKKFFLLTFPERINVSIASEVYATALIFDLMELIGIRETYEL